MSQTAMLSSTSAHALSVSGLSKAYGDHRVLNGLDLQVDKGSVHGLVGLNGSGKTTTLECLLGLQKFNDGEIKLLEFLPRQLHLAQGRIVAIFDTPSLNPNLTVRQCLEQAALMLKHKDRSAPELEDLLGISPYSTFKIKNLSLGNKRRTSIAHALLSNPEFILLDEPFNGLDAGGVDDILELIGNLNRENGTSFLLSSHQLPYLEKICSHISILHEGRIAASDTLQNMLRGNRWIKLATPAMEQAKAILEQTEGCNILQQPGDGYLYLESESMDSASLNSLLVGNDVPVSELILQQASLENLFREITGAKSA